MTSFSCSADSTTRLLADKVAAPVGYNPATESVASGFSIHQKRSLHESRGYNRKTTPRVPSTAQQCSATQLTSVFERTCQRRQAILAEEKENEEQVAPIRELQAEAPMAEKALPVATELSIITCLCLLYEPRAEKRVQKQEKVDCTAYHLARRMKINLEFHHLGITRRTHATGRNTSAAVQNGQDGSVITW